MIPGELDRTARYSGNRQQPEAQPFRLWKSKWSDELVALSGFLFCFSGCYDAFQCMQDAFSELIDYSQNSGLPVTPDIIADMDKGKAWFDILVRLYFSGMSLDGYSMEDLGLTGKNQKCDEHLIFGAVVKKIQSAGDLRNREPFIDVVEWLAHIDLEAVFPDRTLIRKLPCGLKSMQPETCHLVSKDGGRSREVFDPQCFNNDLYLFKNRHVQLRQFLLEPFLVYGPREYVQEIMEKWLNDGSVCRWLFTQHYYPLNTLDGEYYPWTLLLHALPRILPEALGEKRLAFRKLDGDGVRVDMGRQHDPHWQSQWINVFGRTLIARPGNCRRYLKVQSSAEFRSEFKRGYQRLQSLKAQCPELESHIPVPVRVLQVDVPQKLMDQLSCQSPEQEQRRKIFTEKVKENSSLAMEFTTPADLPYEEYVYDLTDEAPIMEALGKYARDYGRLWRQGLLPPPCLSAFHDVSRDKKHVMLTPFNNMRCEGALERWNGQATDYPNIGGPVMGMRDKVDIRLPEEVEPYYFSRRGINPAKLEGQNLVRLEELAKAAQGLCLQYARIFNDRFDYRNPESLEAIKRHLGSLFIDLFSHALPLGRDYCEKIMKEHDLLDQCVREVAYWLAKETPYVEDLRRSDINRSVYPLLPPDMQGCILPESDRQFLKDCGFHDPGRDREGECQLGAGSGRMPLIALNAMVVKLLAYGTLAIISQQQEMASRDARMMASQPETMVA